MRVEPDGEKARLLLGEYDLPASDDTVSVEEFDGTPGVYSLTAHSREYGSVDTHVGQVTADDGPLQFEVVIQRHGAVWTALGDVDDTISIPGYSPDKTQP